MLHTLYLAKRLKTLKKQRWGESIPSAYPYVHPCMQKGIETKQYHVPAHPNINTTNCRRYNAISSDYLSIDIIYTQEKAQIFVTFQNML